MSAIACLVHFDGRPIAPGVVEAMTDAMLHRGPDGLAYWNQASVALGHCMRHSTPESVHEIQPLPNEDASVCLVLDGRVDNREPLRQQLLSRGARLRDDTDAELVLRAYEVWGEDCPHHVIGECAFLLWDGREKKLFAARDAAGTKPLYYAVLDQGLAVSTEVKGLLALPGFKAKLNQSRFLDFWVNEFDRIDEVSTVYQGIVRLPAGHAMRADVNGVRTWRYWDPSQLKEARFASLDDCAEAFRDQLRQAVQCRLRSIKPMSATLSGGLDSSTLVGMISKDFRDQLTQPLRTYSLVDEDRAHCLDSQCVESIVRADPWLQPSIITSARAHEMWQWLDAGIAEADDVFGAAHTWVYSAIRRDAQQDGCGHMFEGMAGDLLFYSRPASISGLMWDSQWMALPAYLWRLHRFGWPVSKDVLNALVSRGGAALPPTLLTQLRRIKDERSLAQGDLSYLRRDVAQALVQQRRATVREQEALLSDASSMQRQAARYTSGSLSFSYEVGANARVGPDGRSPYSDRRMMEFAVSMPLQAKMVNPWYKQLLRKVASHYLPAQVVWRKQVGYHPGWRFHAHLFDKLVEHKSKTQFLKDHVEPLSAWVQPERIMQAWQGVKDKSGHANGWPVYSAYVASTWLKNKGL